MPLYALLFRSKKKAQCSMALLLQGHHSAFVMGTLGEKSFIRREASGKGDMRSALCSVLQP